MPTILPWTCGLFCFGLVLAFACPRTVQAVEPTNDSAELIQRGLKEKTAVLLDVREEGEWNEGHLKDARPLPLSKLKAGIEAKELAAIAPKDKIIYCHCKSGRRSLAAAEILSKQGYDVRPLRLGYADLLKEGFAPAEK